MWVLDTNTLIYFFKGQGDVAHQLLTQSPLEIGIPAIVLFELEVGIAKSSSPKKRRQQLAELVSIVKVLPFVDKEAKAATKVRVQLERAGFPIGPHDTLIAGTALANGGILVTRNTREFERVAGLQFENWF